MPSIYDIDYSKVGAQLMPPDKRFTNSLSWIKILLSPIQYLRDIYLGSYRTGSTATGWVISSPYPKYAQVIYNKIVYESLVDANSAVPTDITKWRVIQSNFIGVSERILYSGQKLVLEYAMNTWFGTVFRQPPNTSDIYITNNSLGISVFRVAGIEDISSIVLSDNSSEFIINAYSLTVPANFTIHCPVAVYNALDVVAINREKIFRAFVDRYVPAGVTYDITTY